MSRIKHNKGFTLIELLVYIGLVVLIGGFLSVTIFYLEEFDLIAFTYNETMQNGRESMEIMSRYIHKADSVVTPASAGVTSNNLVLSIGGNNVTFSTTPEGRLQLQDTAGNSNLTTNKVRINNLTFKRVQNSSTKPTIQVSIQVVYIGTVIRGPNPTINLTTTVGLR